MGSKFEGIFAHLFINKFPLNILYDFFISLYYFIIRIAAFFNVKANEWVKGRKNLYTDLDNKHFENNNIIWIHSASAGEFEQAKPVIEALKEHYPDHQIAVSFFSSSGYKVATKYTLADYIFYLPLDTAKNAQSLLKKLNPKLVIFIKYDFWYHHLKAIRQNNIPLLLVSSIFRKEQVFFKWYGGFFKKILHFFTWIFVQNESSLDLLHKAGIKNVSIGGDTRFDRVLKIAGQFKDIPFLNEFIQNNPVLVAGSTWPDDDRLLLHLSTTKGFEKVKLIIAPHEIGKDKINTLNKNFPNSIKYSQINDGVSAADFKVLIIDNFGMLSRLYHYATITYIGGGFNKSGIHNTLEAAVWGKPVIFGPHYQKFKEAIDLIKVGAGFSIQNADDLTTKVFMLLDSAKKSKEAGEASLQYIHTQKGATEKVVKLIQEKRLLTRL